jgi:serine/threonine protein phosphatase 1
MAANLTRGLFAGRTDQLRRRDFIDNASMPTYAIGDVHGCHDLLAALEEKIVADAARLPGRKLLVMLGDFIDRGPNSARVLSRLMGPPPPDFDRICLTGNHEITMLAYMDEKISLADWRSMGADATLQSYGLDAAHLARQHASQKKLDDFIRASLPADHVNFLRSLAIMLDTPSTLFVHAGIEPDRSIAEQTDEDLVYIRSRFLDSPRPMPKLVVHGHTPVKQVWVNGERLNLDTGAFRSGRLTAARFWRGRVHVAST